MSTPSTSPAPDAPASASKFQLVELSLTRMDYEITLVLPGVKAEDVSLTFRIGAKTYPLLDRKNPSDDKITFSIEFDYVNDVFSWPIATLKGPGVDLELKGTPDDPSGRLEVLSSEDAKELIRQRAVRRSGNGIYYHLFTAHQAHLYGLNSGDFGTASFSLCSVGWRFMELDEQIDKSRIAWILEREKVCAEGLKGRPAAYARWYPSLATMTVQLLCTKGRINEAYLKARTVIDQGHLLEECPMSGYNFALNFLFAAFLKLVTDKNDDLSAYADWGTLFKRITGCMEIRYGTMREFQVIYDAMFLAARVVLTRQKHKDRHFQDVTVDEFVAAPKIFRVRLSKNQITELKRGIKRLRNKNLEDNPA